MGKREKLRDYLASKGNFGLTIYSCILRLRVLLSKKESDEVVTARRFKRVFGRDIDMVNPRTLNEKIQWLKLNYRKDIQTVLADKFCARAYLAQKFGDQYLIPLLFETSDWRNITIDNLPDEPFIIKPNHGTGQYTIVRDKSRVDIVELRTKCVEWLSTDFYRVTQEWQYKNIKRRIIIEKLLQTKDGSIPNDYKLNYFNGKLEFIYCSVGRESENKRNVYDPNWNPIYFSWVEPHKDASNIRGKEIPAPPSFNKMKEIGDEIAKMFTYVRVDFYDVDGKLYFGEVTFHHGGGYDVFVPEKFDWLFGEKLKLPRL